MEMIGSDNSTQLFYSVSFKFGDLLFFALNPRNSLVASSVLGTEFGATVCKKEDIRDSNVQSELAGLTDLILGIYLISADGIASRYDAN